MSGKIRQLKRHLKNARSYESWREMALELDVLEGHDDWKSEYFSEHYNYELIYERLQQIKHCHSRQDTLQLVRCLREGLHHDLGNMCNDALYTQSYFGTKHLIEEYVNQVCESLQYVCDNPIEGFDTRKKLNFFKDTALSFGRPALLLSGGATLGMFHLGVIKALWERDLIPQVIAGSSVGSIIAAMLGTHTDAEIPAMLHPSRHNLKAWRYMGLFHGLRGKGFMDQKQLEACIRANVGEYSFEEAYERTGRSINVTVSPVHEHQKARLLSGYTSPYLLVWSAALASCSVPMIFPPTRLMKKGRAGELEPYMPKLRWVDGSVVSDLPIERLMHLYDVNFSIVSQTNPHIVPFLTGAHAMKKRGFTSWPMRIMQKELMFHGTEITDFLRKRSNSQLFRQLWGQAYTVMAQRYQGDVTIHPQYRFRHFGRVLSNPTPELVEDLTLQGERATWPKISLIRSHAKISQTLEDCIIRLREQLDSRKAQLHVIAS